MSNQKTNKYASKANLPDFPWQQAFEQFFGELTKQPVRIWGKNICQRVFDFACELYERRLGAILAKYQASFHKDSKLDSTQRVEALVDSLFDSEERLGKKLEQLLVYLKAMAPDTKPDPIMLLTAADAYMNPDSQPEATGMISVPPSEEEESDDPIFTPDNPGSPE